MQKLYLEVKSMKLGIRTSITLQSPFHATLVTLNLFKVAGKVKKYTHFFSWNENRLNVCSYSCI